jgi:hypothetical protein
MNAELSQLTTELSGEKQGIIAARFQSPLVPARYVLLALAASVTGYTVKAMQRKIERGDWIEGRVWRRAPDGRILIDLIGYQQWVEGA